MNNKCRVFRSNGKSAPDGADLLTFAKSEIKPALEAIFNNDEYYHNDIIRPSKMKEATIAFLQSLGDRYFSSEHTYIVLAINSLLDRPAWACFRQMLPPGLIIDYLKHKGTASEASHKIQSDQILENISNENDAVDYFLHNAYGLAVLAKIQLQRKMNNIVLNSFVIDRKNGVIISNIEEAIDRVKQNKVNLFKDIQHYFRIIGDTSEISKVVPTKNNVEELINRFRGDISKKVQVGFFTGSDLQQMYDDAYNNNVDTNVKIKAKATLNAYGSWLALLNFDNFIKIAIGDTVIINPSSELRYSYSNKGTNINTTWRKDDNIDLLAEINKLTQALINTSPVVQFGTSTAIEGSYMLFSDFSYITAKIKDLVYKPEAATLIFLGEESPLMQSLEPEERAIIKNMSLRLVISNSRRNPQKYTPIIYKILSFSDGENAVIDRFTNFNKLDRNLLWTIYKNIYDPNFNGMGEDPAFRSLYSIQKNNVDSKNYYAAVSSVSDCIFSVDFAQYVYDGGVLKLRTLRDAAVDKTRREIETVINTKNSTLLVSEFNFNEYGITEINNQEDNTLDGISFSIKLDNGDKLYLHVRDMGEDVKISKYPSPKAEALSLEELRILDSDESIRMFFDEVLGLNLSRDAEFRKTYQELNAENGDGISPYMTQMLQLTGQIFFNRYFAHTRLSQRPYRAGKLQTIEEYFKNENRRPKFNDRFFNMDMIPKSKYNTLLNLAQALGTTRGLNSSRLVKDGDNAMLSSQTLSRLLGNMVQLFETLINAYNQTKDLRAKIKEKQELLNGLDPNLDLIAIENINNEILEYQKRLAAITSLLGLLDTDQNPAAASFGIITNPGLFKGMLKSEEIKGVFGNKKQVKFTTSEAVISSFLHNFVLGHCSKEILDKNSELGGGVVGLLPSVNSDKTTVSIAKFDLNTVIPGSNITYLELDNPAIVDLIQKEMGLFYSTMVDNIKSDFQKLIDFYLENNELPIVIDPENNFSGFSNFIQIVNNRKLPGETKVTPALFLFNLVNLYNNKNPQNPIRLIDQIHYVEDKNGNISFNNTIKSLQARFADPLTTAEFFKLKNTEVLKSALDSGFVITLFGHSNLDNQPEINYLRQHYGDWVNDSGLMVLARANVGGKSYNITNSSDLLSLEKTLTLQRMLELGIDDAKNLYLLNPEGWKIKCGFDRLSTKTHLLRDIITLHPMLEKYNLMDYLFTQLVMASTVGSHVAHPAKGSFSKMISLDDVKKNKHYKAVNGFHSVVKFVDSISSDREVPVAARNTGSEILLVESLLRLKYESKSWLNPAILSDNSQAKPLEPNQFESFEEFVTFVLEHETAHIFNKRYPRESIGDYETRINNIALEAIKFKRLQALLAEEASRFYAQHKRNVSFTASMDLFLLNQIDGIPTWYNIAIIDDIKEGLFTMDGNTDEAKPYDGATYVNPIIMYLENNSLNESRAGIDKKLFVHYYDELTGTGGIIKTAGFALTNDRMRNAVFYRDMMRNMTDRVWRDYQGNIYVANILENFKGLAVDYGTFYFKEGNKYFKATLTKGELPNSYVRNVVEINLDGSVVIDGKLENLTFKDVNTNYKLWEMFGGMHSQEFNGGLLQPSETSLLNVTKAVVNTGKLKPGYVAGDITAENIDLPLKNADIHYMPTIGAVKQGAANINPKSFYHGKHDLNFFRIRMTNAGIQLDKEHHADDSTLSLMTQVISSACSMGYTPKLAERLYKALYSLTMQGIKEFRNGFIELLNTKDPSKFETAIADCMIKSMLNSSAQDGDMLRAIASDLIEKARKGELLTFADTKTMPYSDPAVFDKLVTTLSVMMTKAGIKAKMSGILSVLCPTNGIVKTYSYVDSDGKRHTVTLSQLEQTFGGDFNTFIDTLQLDQPSDTVTPFYDTSKIDVGSKYIITLEGGVNVVVDLKYPHDYSQNDGTREILVRNNENEVSKVEVAHKIMGYEALKKMIKEGRVSKILEYIKEGKELGSINYHFKGTEGTNYQVWDINYIQRLFETMTLVKNLKSDLDKLNEYLKLISEFDGGLDKFNQAVKEHFASYVNSGNTQPSHMLKLAKLYAKQLQQDILFALSTNNPTKIKSVKIGDEDVVIDKTSIQVLPYEIVMPKIFLKEFGLDEYANLDEISKNPMYFYDRMISNFSTKMLDETHYDLELKKLNGEHIYIKDRAGLQPGWDRDLEKVTIHKVTDELGQVWRVDPQTNQRMYLLFSDQDEVYRRPGTNIEVIVTSSQYNKNDDGYYELKHSGLTHYLNNFKYQSLHISEAIAPGSMDTGAFNDRPKFDDILYYISKSKNKSAKSWIKLFKDPETGWSSDRVDLNRDLNSFDNLGHRLQDHLKELAINVHSSFLKSLDIIAARIPAQNQQSFMPMKVVAFDNPNINTAYVSVMQFFLQGSDLDIDAVSLLTYSFNKNGEFYDWSPEFNMKSKELLDLSTKLPFPTGLDLEVVAYDLGEYVNKNDRKPLLTDNPDFKALAIELIRKNNLTTATYDELLELQYSKKELQHFINLLEFIENHGGVIYLEKQSDLDGELVKTIVDRINKHNTYLKGVSDDVSIGAIKNYIVSSLYSISTDAANILEAHTGVDVATSPFKKIANQSELSEVQKTFTPGNVFNKYQAIEEASVGKDDIAICATGLKAFFAATQFCNSYMNQSLQSDNLTELQASEIFKIVKFEPVTIGGRTFKTLANIRVNDLSKLLGVQNSEVYRILKDKGFDEDASVIMSALLSLSTDNAKELCLAKINAGTGMIGMYLYGAAIGMDFEVMNKIIASPLGFTIAKLLNSNEFTQQRGKTSVDLALSYLFDGPSLRDLQRFNGVARTDRVKTSSTFEMFESVLNNYINGNESYLSKLNAMFSDGVPDLTMANFGRILSLYVRWYGVTDALNLLSGVRSTINMKISRDYLKPFENNTEKLIAYKALINQMFDFWNEFANLAETLRHTKYTTDYGESDIKDDLNKLALGADEFKRLGLFLRLNLEIKTKPDELVNFVLKIESCIDDRIKLIDRVNKRLGKNTQKVQDLEPLDFMKFAESFVTNGLYHTRMIELYESYCKSCVNPLRIITLVPHYRGYLESMILAYEGNYRKSVKFRAIKHIGIDFIRKTRVTTSSDKQAVLKGVLNFVDEYINNAFLSDLELFILPKSTNNRTVDLVDKYDQIIPNDHGNSYIKLGTEAGNKTFERFFEKVFIPILKEQFEDNLFVLGLNPLVITDNITGIKHLTITLPINMMPTSDNERVLFNRYKNDFNKIAGKTIKIGNQEYSIVLLFQYYNLLKFKGRSGRSSLSHIFEDILAKNPYLIKYREFVNNFDSTYDFKEGVSTTVDEESGRIWIGVDPSTLYKYIAPLSNPTSATSDIIKFSDRNTGETVLLEKNDDRESHEDFGNDDMTNEFGFLEDEESYEYSNPMDDWMYNANAYDPDVYNPDYGNYHEYLGNGALTRISEFYIPMSNPSEHILESIQVDDKIIKNVVISDGKLVYFEYNGERISPNSKAKMVKLVKQQGKPALYVLDTDKINNTIKQTFCG